VASSNLRDLSLEIISKASSPEDSSALQIASDLILLIDEIEQLKLEINGIRRTPVHIAKAS